MSGIFFSELIAGWYINIFFSLFLALRGFSKNFFFIFFCILNIFCLILTGEKSSLLSFVIIIIFNFFFNGQARKYFFSILSLFVIIFFLLISSSNNVYKRFIDDPLKYINEPFYWNPKLRSQNEILLEKHDFEKKVNVLQIKTNKLGIPLYYRILYVC